MIETKYLQLVIAISEYGSLREAAEQLHLTSSALSHQLRELERSLGLKLFNRVHNRLVITAAGTEFRDRASGILAEVVNLEKCLQELDREPYNNYIHGYSQEETQRLNDQANSISDLLHYDSFWEAGTSVLEVGCGVGAQTKIIASQNPEVSFTAVDISERSLEIAQTELANLNQLQIQFQQADVYHLSFASGTFDHVFVCFLLEHLREPQSALLELRRVLKPGGTITVIEGDHGSTYFYPETEKAKQAVAAQVQLQEQKGGDANIGRTLYPLLKQVGFSQIASSPRQVYVDESKPELVEGFIKNTFTAMIKGVQSEAVSAGIMRADQMEQGIHDLYQTAEGGTFCYTFFKAVGRKLPDVR